MTDRPLSKRQKAVISQLAARAWNWCGRECGFDTPADYRHAAVAQVTGGAAGGLRACTQAHYVPLYNFFAAVLGITPIADRTPKTAWDKAFWALRDALARYELPHSYAAAIMAPRLGIAGFADFGYCAARMSAEELMQVTYTVINRGRAAMRKAAAKQGAGVPAEPHVSPSTLPPGGLADHFGASLMHRPVKKTPSSPLRDS